MTGPTRGFSLQRKTYLRTTLLSKTGSCIVTLLSLRTTRRRTWTDRVTTAVFARQLPTTPAKSKTI